MTDASSGAIEAIRDRAKAHLMMISQRIASQGAVTFDDIEDALNVGDTLLAALAASEARVAALEKYDEIAHHQAKMLQTYLIKYGSLMDYDPTPDQHLAGKWRNPDGSWPVDDGVNAATLDGEGSQS